MKSLLALFVMIIAALPAAGSSALPLPDPPIEDIRVPNWQEGRALANSVRAWHYNPSLVRPLLDLGDAVDDSTLSRRTRRMLATVVAARNGCRY